MTRFTKTETLRRLRAAIGEARRRGNLPRNAPAEIGWRIDGVQHAQDLEEALALRFLPGDDLADFGDVKAAAADDDVRTPGAVLHIYLYRQDPFYGRQLEDVDCIWLGTEGRAPVVLDYNGRDLVDPEHDTRTA